MRIIAILLIVVITACVSAEEARTNQMGSPETLKKFIQTAAYPDLLRFIERTYTEGKEGNSAAEYTYVLVLSSVAPETRVRLALDFCFTKPDALLKRTGARIVWATLLSGSKLEENLKARVIAEIKEQLKNATTPSNDNLDLARTSAYSLALLGEATGLDVFLTDREMVRTYQRKDKWGPETDAAIFDNLSKKYSSLGDAMSTNNADFNNSMAALYRLCAQRRLEGIQVRPIRPIADLGKLKVK